MVSELNDISNSTTADQIRLATKRIAALSRYEGRLYSARKRHVQAAPLEQESFVGKCAGRTQLISAKRTQFAPDDLAVGATLMPNSSTAAIANYASCAQ